MTRLLKGRPIAADIRAEVAAAVQEMVAGGARRPGLAAVLVGDDPASKVYVASKGRSSEEVGFLSRTVRLPDDTPEEKLLETVHELNEDDGIHGILVQLPLPSTISSRRVLDAVDPRKDVDGFHPISLGRLWQDEETFVPATPRGILEILRRSEIPLEGRRAVIVGRSTIVGKPMAALLLRENCTVTLAHSRTRDLPAVCREADILVAAIGRPAFFGPEHVREGAVVIDVGINRITDRATVERLYPDSAKRMDTFERRGAILVGDVDFTRAAPRASAITPVPGGIGLLTVALLMANTLDAARRIQGVTAGETL